MLNAEWVLIGIFLIFVWLAYSRSQVYEKREKADKLGITAFIHEKLIGPFVNGLHNYVAAQIPKNANVIVCCCGTGQQVWKLSVHCSKVIGIDSSSRMIKTARTKKEKQNITNVEFLLDDVTEALRKMPDQSVDYATITMALHEMPGILRVPMLKEMGRVAKKVLVVDYTRYMPFSFAKLRNLFLEVIAGAEHFTNFRGFRYEGGLPVLVDCAGLTVESQTLIDAKCVTVLVLKRQEKD